MTPFMFAHVLRAERKAAQRLIEELHYSGSNGNSGFMHAITVGSVVAAACLIGGTLSKGRSRR